MRTRPPELLLDVHLVAHGRSSSAIRAGAAHANVSGDPLCTSPWSAEPAKLRALVIRADVRAQAEVALEEFCATHSSAPGADPLRYVYEFEPNAALLLEQRPGFMNPDDWVSRPIAKLRYSEARNTWSLYWSDANGKWHRASGMKAETDIRAALQSVVTDPLGVFWS